MTKVLRQSVAGRAARKAPNPDCVQRMQKIDFDRRDFCCAKCCAFDRALRIYEQAVVKREAGSFEGMFPSIYSASG
jgi:hypothetical protein